MNKIKYINENAIDIAAVRGSAEYIVSREIEGFLTQALTERGGVAYILDHRGNLTGGLNAENVRSAIDCTLNEIWAGEAEANMCEGADLSGEIAVCKAIKANKAAKITVERITSPKTGKKGWRVTWATK